MDIDENVLTILREAGPQGLHVAKISLHVYNGMNNLFEHNNFEEVHHRVNMFLIREARKKKKPMVIRLRRGVYKVNARVFRDMELQFKFAEREQEEHDNGNMLRERHHDRGETENMLPFS